MSLNGHVAVDTSAITGDVTVGDVKRSLKACLQLLNTCPKANTYPVLDEGYYICESRDGLPSR